LLAFETGKKGLGQSLEFDFLALSLLVERQTLVAVPAWRGAGPGDKGALDEGSIKKQSTLTPTSGFPMSGSLGLVLPLSAIAQTSADASSAPCVIPSAPELPQDAAALDVDRLCQLAVSVSEFDEAVKGARFCLDHIVSADTSASRAEVPFALGQCDDLSSLQFAAWDRYAALTEERASLQGQSRVNASGPEARLRDLPAPKRSKIRRSWRMGLGSFSAER
jgi:hypothetical protein